MEWHLLSVSKCYVQRKTHKRKPKVEATSAFEAMEKMVQERKLSKKINYDVLKDLNPAAFKPDAVEFAPQVMTNNIEMCGGLIVATLYVPAGQRYRAATWSLKSPKVPLLNTWSLMSLNLKKWSLESLFLCNWLFFNLS